MELAVSLLQTMKTIWATVSLIAFCLMSTGTRSQESSTQMTLPTKGHVYVLRTVDGKTQLVQLKYVPVQLNKHIFENLAKTSAELGFSYKIKRTVEIAGTTSSVHFQQGISEFYVRGTTFDTDDAAGPQVHKVSKGELAILRLLPQDKHRIVSTRLMDQLTAHVTRSENVLAMTTDAVADTGWVHLVTNEPLAPGEYGLVLLPQSPVHFGNVVFDFAIDPPA